MGLFISITPESGGDAVVLCDSPDPIPSFNFRINNQRVIQVNRLYLASYQKVKGRKNKINRIQFDVPARSVDADGAPFADMVDAVSFAIEHVNDVPDVGVLTIIITDGGASATYFFDNAGVESADMVRYRGESLAFQYSILCGQPLSEAP